MSSRPGLLTMPPLDEVHPGAASARGRRGDPGSLTIGIALGLWALSLALDPSPIHGPVDWPSLEHPLGVDGQGRDLLAALAHAQYAIFVGGFVGCAIGLGGGTVLGVLAGLLGGPVEIAVRYGCLVLAVFPRLVWLLLVATAFGGGSTPAIVALGLSFVPDVVGDVFQRVRQLAHSDFFAASRAVGISWTRLIGHHLVRRHLLAPLARQAAFVFAYALMVELALTYMGGWTGFLQVDTPDLPIRLGSLLLDARRLIEADTPFGPDWWPLMVCGAFVVVLVGGLYALGTRPGRGRR